MTIWFRKLVLVLAFGVMPLQGIAATLSVLYCHGDAQAHTAHADDGHNHVAHHDGHHNSNPDGGTGGHTAYHLCCNVTMSAPPIMTYVAVPTYFPVLAFVPDPLHDLFFPDQPQRPPLA
jgi:hypothetical protein